MFNASKPLILAAALALGASASAYGQSTAYTSTEEHGGMRNNVMNRDSGLRGAADNTNAIIAPASPGAQPSSTYSGEGSYGYQSGSRADHGTTYMNGARNNAGMSGDARERAARAARSTPDEEHGGTRNWIHEKKDQARQKLGMQPDND